MVELIHGFGKEAVFPRAFDCAGDPYEAMETLIGLRVDRGASPAARRRRRCRARTCSEAAGQVRGQNPDPGGPAGWNAANAGDLMERTGLTQVHSSCKGWRRDETTTGERVHYRFAPDPHGDDYDVVSEELVRRLVESAG